MKVSIVENPTVEDIQVEITCSRIDNRVNRIVASLNAFSGKLVGVHKGQTFIVVPDEVFYFETVDRKTFMYTADKVLETQLRLYEVKELFEGTEFIQISKQMIVNFDKVIAIRPDFNARLQLKLSNSEAVIVSRQFSSVIKQKLGTFR